MSKLYLVRYENGASQTIEANSIEEAIIGARNALLSCMPKGFLPENLVEVTCALAIGYCGVCGKKVTKKRCCHDA